ncbi:hypothetical protein PRIPAC_79754 [Pristionchus pacificus]|uniref:Uncharacterized protein n=1 Tax=Pristionchus pacificus TaxID=54126 RepID=A0A2A6CQ38_PRIPA|nr:hypothetical protein PRIPAC_79754 [Pristionchus pacificus]|eukprot:PDM80151.1 hypothetical protein PRIPAC_32730 [Pristionchus pacificus]
MSVTILDRSPTGDNDEVIAMITTGVNHICVLFAAIAIPLTTLVLAVLMRRQAYSRSPFFTICKLTHFLIYFTRTGQAITNLFICLDRATAILLPLFHDEIWRNAFLLPACIISELVISAALGFMAGSFDVHWIRYPQGQLFSALKQGANLRVFLRAIFVPVLGIILVIIVLYIRITYQIRSRHVVDASKSRILTSVHKKESVASSSVEKKQSSSLLYIAVCSVAMEIVYFATFFYAFIYSVSDERDERIFSAIFLSIRNCYSGLPCLLLCLFCSSVRGDVRRSIRASCEKVPTSFTKMFEQTRISVA